MAVEDVLVRAAVDLVEARLPGAAWVGGAAMQPVQRRWWGRRFPEDRQ